MDFPLLRDSEEGQPTRDPEEEEEEEEQTNHSSSFESLLQFCLSVLSYAKWSIIRFVTEVHQWWIKTTHEEYLHSWASRRQLWKIFLVPWALQNAFTVQHLGYNGHMVLRVSLALISVSLPKQKIWSDAVMVTCYLCPHLVDYAFIEGSDLSSIGYSSIILLFFLGVHSYAIMLHCILLCSFNMSNFFEFTIMFGLGCIVEARAAGIYWDLQESKQITEMLLDNATDGFCSVDCSTGIIRNASPKLERTLQCRPLEGRRFAEFLHREELRRSSERIFDATSGIANCRPRLMSCVQYQERGTFDAKIIPFTKAGQTVQLCLQVQGEMRTLYKDDVFTDTNTNGHNGHNHSASIQSFHSDHTQDLLQDEESQCSSVGAYSAVEFAFDKDRGERDRDVISGLRQMSGSSNSNLSSRMGLRSGLRRSGAKSACSQVAPSEVSFSYSATDSLWTGFSPERRRRPSTTTIMTPFHLECIDVGSQTEVSIAGEDRMDDLRLFSGISGREDKEAQTHLNWSQDGFTCSRCSKPPVLPWSQLPMHLPATCVRRGRSPPRYRPVRPLEIFPLRNLPKDILSRKKAETSQPRKKADESPIAEESLALDDTLVQQTDAPAESKTLPVFPPSPADKKKGGRRRLGRNVSAIQLADPESPSALNSLAEA